MRKGDGDKATSVALNTRRHTVELCGNQAEIQGDRDIRISNVYIMKGKRYKCVFSGYLYNFKKFNLMKGLRVYRIFH